MRAILSHESRRAVEARQFRREVSAGCALPVVELPVFGEGTGADDGWRARSEAILAAPFWPVEPAAGLRETGTE